VLIVWSLTIAARMLRSPQRLTLAPLHLLALAEVPRSQDSRLFVPSILRC
jgi:hypothetical protein